MGKYSFVVKVPKKAQISKLDISYNSDKQDECKSSAAWKSYLIVPPDIDETLHTPADVVKGTFL